MHSPSCRYVNLSIRAALCVSLLLCSQPARALVTSEMSLDVRGAWYRTSEGLSSIEVLFELNIPLEPKRPSFNHGSMAQDEQTTPVDEVPLDPLERDNPDPADERRDPDWEQDTGRDGLIAEPPAVTAAFLADLTAASLLAQGCDQAWSRLEGLGTRNRVSALLPEVSLRAGREQNTALRLTPTDADPFRYAQSDMSNTLLEGRLAWRLGRLLFSSEDLGIERLRLARERERQRVVERTLSVFFQWLRAQSELAATRKRGRRTRALGWEVAQAAMRLDALTAGWFTAHASRALPPSVGTLARSGSTLTPADASRTTQAGSPVPDQQEKGKSDRPR